MASESEHKHQPACMMTHDLVNKLGAIVGHCDLLIEQTGQDSEFSQRLTLIRGIAEKAAKDLAQHQRESAAENRKAGQIV